MSDFVHVEISAEAKVRYEKNVLMSRADYQKYLDICEDSPKDIDDKVKAIAINYGFWANNSDIDGIDDPEYIEFKLIQNKQQNTEGK